MIYFQYTALGVYTGETLNLDPKDPIPRYHTSLSIPDYDSNVETPVFMNGAWVVTDNENLPSMLVEDQNVSWDQVREERDSLLRVSDQESFITLPDVWGAKTTEQQNAWLTYRQDLRDITTDYDEANEVIWPDKPV